MPKKQTVWKEFRKNEITHSMAHYLMAIYQLNESQGYARLSDIAKRLNISKGSLSTSLKPLISRRLIKEDENKHLTLSKHGRECATRIQNTCSVLKSFLIDVLGVAKEAAEVDACKIEHLLSEESSTAILRLVKALDGDVELLKTVRASMKKYKHCSTEGCKVCPANHFCLEF